MKITKKSLVNIFNRRNYDAFYTVLQDSIDDFFKWFRLKSEKFKFNKFIGNLELPDTFTPELGKCFKNSQYFHFFHAYDYFEGFTSVIADEIQFVYHAFNVKDRLMSDFTFYSNMEEIPRFLNFLPDFHLGIKIPQSIIDDIFISLQISPNETRTSDSHFTINSILYY